VTVGLILVFKFPKTGDFTVGEEKLSTCDLGLIQDVAFAIRDSAKIVDTPCNYMHTDQFIEVFLTEIDSILFD